MSIRTMNRVYLIGNLGAKPELRTSKAGKPFTRLSVATERYRGPNEEAQPEWHSVFVFGTDAQNCVRYLNSGALLMIEGTLSYWNIDAKTEGGKKYENAINAEVVRFLTYGRDAAKTPLEPRLDNPGAPRNHNAVAHL